ncbi:MAG: hypothetical protein NTW37_07670 [Proteobacteria bacterium]|nr:hypothetical protein [Pseudomonadota bacterium]
MTFDRPFPELEIGPSVFGHPWTIGDSNHGLQAAHPDRARRTAAIESVRERIRRVTLTVE